ncbi:DUF4231 domain-containing protein [Nocardia fusca]|uniref:DUF4231 domain-containing protein n=1 Tax=Nocardia fusca TaxID=941183 RepID=UPI00378AA2F3
MSHAARMTRTTLRNSSRIPEDGEINAANAHEMKPTDRSDRTSYAIRIADESYNWYRRAAIRSRRMYRGVEVAQLFTAALIPLSPVLLEGNTLVPAVLGSGVVVFTGLRSIFHWHENYLRFSQSREAVDAERRAYFTGAAPYAHVGTRDGRLVAAVTAIEQRELGTWLEIAGPRGKQPREDPATEEGATVGNQ